MIGQKPKLKYKKLNSKNHKRKMMVIQGIRLTGGCDVIEAAIDRGGNLFMWEGSNWRLKREGKEEDNVGTTWLAASLLSS